MIILTERGLYCEKGNFWIDPKKGVETALITHAHSDHARRGSKRYLCAESGVELLRKRLGRSAVIEGVPYGQKLSFGELEVSFHPAGHVLGSAQIRVARPGEVWVASGDYKRDGDPSCEPFEVVPCDTFITEGTFAHPQYQWGDTSATVREIHEWWEGNRRKGKNCLLFCYALGKAQRLLAELALYADREVWVSPEIHELAECYRARGVRLLPSRPLHGEIGELRGELVLAPQSLLSSEWAERLRPFETAFASGWMQTGAFGMGRRYDRGFVLSDHADWPALLETIRATGARRVLVHEGSAKALVRALRELGIRAQAIDAYSDERSRRKPVQGDLFTGFVD